MLTPKACLPLSSGSPGPTPCLFFWEKTASFWDWLRAFSRDQNAHRNDGAQPLFLLGCSRVPLCCEAAGGQKSATVLKRSFFDTAFRAFLETAFPSSPEKALAAID